MLFFIRLCLHIYCSIYNNLPLYSKIATDHEISSAFDVYRAQINEIEQSDLESRTEITNYVLAQNLT